MNEQRPRNYLSSKPLKLKIQKTRQSTVNNLGKRRFSLKKWQKFFQNLEDPEFAAKRSLRTFCEILRNVTVSGVL